MHMLQVPLESEEERVISPRTHILMDHAFLPLTKCMRCRCCITQRRR